MKIVALAGGVGGAKLADGFYRARPNADLTVIVNTGDDFTHLGLRICPDLDTVCYTLAGLANPLTGWGRLDESYSALDAIEILGGPTWFRLGDRDLGTHLVRSDLLRAGNSLSEITQKFCQRWGIQARILPMSDEPVATIVHTKSDGDLAFQYYFVRLQCQPEVTGFTFQGIEDARPVPGILEAIQSADLVVVCPSNPWVSISPNLGIQGIRDALVAKKNVVAVSPLIGGQALKGPAAKMYKELGWEPAALSVADQYKDFITMFLLDSADVADCEEIRQWGIIPYVSDIIMKDIPGRIRLAELILNLASQQQGGTQPS